MRKTTNYGLTLYDKEDKMSITSSENSLNANMEIIDKKLKEISDKPSSGGSNIEIDGLITPDMLDLRANWGMSEEEEEEITGETDITDTVTIVEGSYVSQNSDTAITFVSQPDQVHWYIDVTGGDVIAFNGWDAIASGYLISGNYYYNYFIFADDNNKPVIKRTEILNYVTYDAETNFYTVTIPTGATKFYSSRTSSYANTLVVKKLSGSVGGTINKETFNIGWLRITEDNLPDDFYENITSEVISNIPVSSEQNSRLITHNPYGRIDFNNKSIVSYGDSITAGAYATTPYIKALATKYSMTLTNRATSGTTIAQSTNGLISDKIISNTDDKDIIVIAGGTNDWTLGVPLGSYGDTTNETFYGALYVICEHLKTNSPNAKIIFLTPINRFLNGVRPVASLNAYRQAITEMALKYGFAVVDGRQLGMPDTEDTWAKEMLPDGLHPGDLGHTVICNSLIGILS